MSGLIRQSLIVFSLIVPGLIFVPPLINSFSEPTHRQLQGVTLDQLEYKEVGFRNKLQNLQLGGMLFTPESEGPFPAVVIIHGSGTSQRENIWYLTLTKYLQDKEVLVLLPDKRGSEKSQGDWHSASFEDLATDTIAAVNWLNEQKALPISEIGIIGMSQGGHIAPIVGRSLELPYIVNIVGAGVSMHEQFQYEETHNLKQMGVLPGIADLLARLTTFVHREIGSNKIFWSAIGNYDPMPDWSEIKTETLVMYGEKDTNVPVKESVARFRQLNKSNIEIKVYPESGHALEDPKDKGNRIFREDALTDLANFIHGQS